jgi:branched-chain amino acid transport system permease protein
VRLPSWIRLPQQTLLRHGLFAVLAGIVFYNLSINTSDFQQIRFATVAYTLIAVAGLTVLVGLNGQLSLGHGALMAVGAYTVALLQKHQSSWPLWLDLVLAVLVTAVVGAVTGAAAARLRGPYLAGATLALAVGVPGIARQYFDGDTGIGVPLVHSPAALPSLAPDRWTAWFSWLAALITLVLLANLARSRMGREWQAARDDEVAAALSGIRVARVQVIAFIVSAACAGLGGGLLAVVSSSANPAAFGLLLSVGLLAAAIVGGLGSLVGALWGSIIIVYLPIWSNDISLSLDLPSNVRDNLPLAMYGAALIIVMLLAPIGIQGTLYRILRLLRRDRVNAPVSAAETAATGTRAPDTAPTGSGPTAAPATPDQAPAAVPATPSGDTAEGTAP